jgi:hypothetical protein
MSVNLNEKPELGAHSNVAHVLAAAQRQITPEELRAAALVRNATWLPIMASYGPMLADAMEIADDCARANIECECLSHPGGGYDLASINEPPEIEAMLLQSVRYLVARGLATQEGSIVRFKA